MKFQVVSTQKKINHKSYMPNCTNMSLEECLENGVGFFDSLAATQLGMMSECPGCLSRIETGRFNSAGYRW